ncbi:MAG: substrate-binding domain-containing protein [Microbacterium sp.]|uniref:substrate-binding domain-containing protein n=1 Tax=Microbacterium sp. TaxID=51671 RepID=UPI001ACC6E9D|nr:substrate-binding domain-containing protein [Microbacterium sp.]MBN9178216.1 substrate-binding domain-containing protein [Microbacterium sp.]
MRAISSMATRALLADLAAAAHAAGAPSLEIESVGGVDAEARVAAGEPVDLVFLASGALARLARDGHVDASTVTPIALSQVAVAVPSEGVDAASSPTGTAFDDASGLRAALRAAGRVGYSTGPSGTALVGMIEEWGLTGELGDRLVQARPGIPVAASLAAGDVDLGFQQLSELVGQPGIRVLGVLPADCAIDTTFSGAVATASTDSVAAEKVLALFASEKMTPIIERHSFTLV